MFLECFCYKNYHCYSASNQTRIFWHILLVSFINDLGKKCPQDKENKNAAHQVITSLQGMTTHKSHSKYNISRSTIHTKTVHRTSCSETTYSDLHSVTLQLRFGHCHKQNAGTHQTAEGKLTGHEHVLKLFSIYSCLLRRDAMQLSSNEK